MKKILLISISIISCLFLVDKVSANELEYEYLDYLDFSYSGTEGISSFYTFTENYKNFPFYNKNLIDASISNLVGRWEKDYREENPYYFISIISYPIETWDNYSNVTYILQFQLFYFKAIPNDYNSFKSIISGTYPDVDYISLFYDREGISSEKKQPSLISVNLFEENYYLPTFYYDSNFDLSFGLDDTYIIKKDNETLFILNKQDIVPTYKSKFSNQIDLNYVEVDLNNYPYIILSLKDYSKTEEFSAINYVKGQYCLTSVYNYGSTEKKDIIEGSKNKRCSLYYDDFTPVRTYILDSDLKNNAIYYLKAYDTSKENKVKIDTSVFNIHYISEEDKDNPIITINGKKYTPKSYDELTDTATKSEDENYVDGASEKFSITDIFTSPLEFFKKIINAISEFNGLIKELFSFLPDEFLAFILAAFALLVVVAIIKIIL